VNTVTKLRVHKGGEFLDSASISMSKNIPLYGLGYLVRIKNKKMSQYTKTGTNRVFNELQ
jgi:hypothetical protein